MTSDSGREIDALVATEIMGMSDEWEVCPECNDCPDLVPYGHCGACDNRASKAIPRMDKIYVVGKHGRPSRYEYVRAARTQQEEP